MKKIPLRRQDGTVRAYALVDDDDFERLSRYRWHMTAGYVARTDRSIGKRRELYLHREIMDLQPGDSRTVDHIDGDRLDNRRSKLRICTHAQNQQNRRLRPSTRGVHFNKQRQKWEAHVGIDGRKVYLGLYMTEAEASDVAANYRLEHMSHATS